MALNPQKWVELHGDALFRFALQRVSNRDTATELVQETFLAALKNQAQFQGRSSERTWLTSILKFKIIDHYRRSSSSQATSVDSPEELDIYFQKYGSWKDHPQSWGAIPSDTLENKEFWSVFERCVAHLPARLQRVFTLREIDQLETQEVCNVLGITPTNLVVMMHRSRLRLRKCMEVGWFGRPQEGG
jgi:RNA polymerase sigma-70 factor (ECF subfamily)